MAAAAEEEERLPREALAAEAEESFQTEAAIETSAMEWEVGAAPVEERVPAAREAAVAAAEDSQEDWKKN